MHGDHIHKASGIKTKEVLLQNQVIFAAAPFFFKEGNPRVPNISISRFKRSGLMRKA